MVKTCTTCGEERPMSGFYKRKDGRYASSCKVCIRETNKIHQRELREAARLWQAQQAGTEEAS